ncbi:MAG: hypothetical protein WA446_07300 [Steroidobacteraceae bacterium]
MEAQHRIRVVATQKQAFLNQSGRGIDQCDSVHLRLARPAHIYARSIENRNHVSTRIVDRGCRTRQTDVAGPKVVRLMDRDRLALRHAGTDAVCALALFAPFGADDEPGTVEQLFDGRVDPLAQDDTGCVGEQQCVSRAGNLFVQGIHFRLRDID